MGLTTGIEEGTGDQGQACCKRRESQIREDGGDHAQEASG